MLGIAAIKLWLTLNKGQGRYKVKRPKLESPFSRLLMIVESKTWYQKKGNCKPNNVTLSNFSRQVALM